MEEAGRVERSEEVEKKEGKGREEKREIERKQTRVSSHMQHLVIL